MDKIIGLTGLGAHRLVKARPVKIATGRSLLQGERFPTTRDLLILEILKIPEILIQTDEDGQALCLSTPYREERAYKARLPGI